MSFKLTGHTRSNSGTCWYERFDGAGFARFCRARYPSKPAQNVAADTGIPACTVKKWLLGQATPGGRAVMALLCVYGPDLAYAMLDGVPEWMSPAARADRSRLLEHEIEVRRAELADLAQGRPP